MESHVSITLTLVSFLLTLLSVNAKSLRELQQKGEKAIGQDPMIVFNRKGPLGVLIPVTQESLPRIQREIQKMLALESLSQSWKLAQEAGLDQLTENEVASEVRIARNAHAKSKRRH